MDMGERKSRNEPAVGLESDQAAESDFSKGVRGKYSKRLTAGTMIANATKKTSRTKGNRG